MSDIVERLRNMHRFNDRREYGDQSPTIYSEAADEIERLRADAARWRYVRRNLQLSSSKIWDGTAWGDFFLRVLPGETADDAIDRLIKEQGP